MALPRAQPLGDADPHLPRRPARPADAGAAATELALLVVAATGGWLPQKLRAWGETLAALPRLLRERRAIQAARTIGAGEFAEPLTASLDSAYLGRAARSRLLAAVLGGYWSLVRLLVGVGRGR